MTYLLFTIRGLYVWLIALLLLSLFIRLDQKISEKPLLIIGVDNSESIKLSSDSVFYKQDFPKKINDLATSCADKFDVKLVSFGDKIKDGFNGKYTDKLTDFSELFNYVSESFSSKNMGALVIASDGIFNRGLQPLYAIDRPCYPIYTIALGDTTLKTDAYIKKLNFPKTVFAKNDFPIEVNVQVDNLNGNTCEIDLIKENKIIQSKTFKVNSNRNFQSETFWVNQEKAGIEHYKISIKELNNEYNYINNQRDIFINVVDDKKKILLLYQAAHPDIAALKESFSNIENFNYEQYKADNFNKNINQYDLVILHQLPSSQFPETDLINTCRKSLIPVLYIIGNQTSISNFNGLATGLTMSITNQLLNESQAGLNQNFSQFTLSEDMSKYFKELPPLSCFFGNYKILSQSYTLAYQKIGNLTTQYPLITFINNQNITNGFICGEGIWKWRSFDYSMFQNHRHFEELFTKVVQYLLTDKSKVKFKVNTNNTYYENEGVEIGAELYNDSYELINTPEVKILLSKDKEQPYSFTFNKSEKAYTLKTSSLPVGIYTYHATTKLGDKALQYSGQFAVNQINIESEQTTADFNLMYKLALKNGGKMYNPKQFDLLFKELNENENIKTLTYTEKRFNEVIRSLILFLILFFLIASELILRKRNGTY